MSDFSKKSRKLYFNRHQRFVDDIKRSRNILKSKFKEINKLKKEICYLTGGEPWCQVISDLVDEKSKEKSEKKVDEKSKEKFDVKWVDYSEVDKETILKKHWSYVNTVKSLESKLNKIKQPISLLEKEIVELRKKEWKKKTSGLNLVICGFMDELGIVVDKYHYDDFLDELEEIFEEEWDDPKCVYTSIDLESWYINNYNYLAGIDRINGGVSEVLIGEIIDVFERDYEGKYKKICDAINEVRK